MEETRNKRVKGRLWREHSGRFREVFIPHLQTQREEVGRWEKAAWALGQALHVRYLLPLHTAPRPPWPPRPRFAVARAGIKLGTSDAGSRFPTALHPSASRPGRKPEKKWDPEPPCHHLFSEIF